MENHKELGFLLLRLGLGVNLFLHGLGRFGANWDKFQTWISTLFADSPLPTSLVTLAGNIIPPAEFLLGLLLILGFKTKWASFGSGLLFINLIFGMSLLQKWDIVGLQMTYLLFSFLLLFFLNHDTYSLDKVLSKGNRK